MLNATMLIRPAVASDVEALCKLKNFYIANSIAASTEQLVSVEDQVTWVGSFASSGPARLYVAIAEDGQLAGFAYSVPYKPKPVSYKMVEVGICLDQNHTGAGLGSALYTTLFDALRHEDLNSMVANINLPNESSIALHRKLGFTEVGIFKDCIIKHGVVYSSLWMQRMLQPPDRVGDQA